MAETVGSDTARERQDAGAPADDGADAARQHHARAHHRLVMFVVAIVGVPVLRLPKLVGFSAEFKHLREGNAWWLARLPACSRRSRSAATSSLFRAVFVHRTSRIGWSASYQITMAGLAATRLFAAAGAGGIALTAWALRRSGMERRARRFAHDRVHGAAVRRLHGRRW